MSSDFINYTFGKLIDDFRRIIQAGVAGIVNEIIENKLKEIEEIKRRIIEIENILKNKGISAYTTVDEKSVSNQPQSSQVAKGPSEKCQYEGCNRDSFVRGYCKNHYYQLKRKGVIKNIENEREKRKCAFDGCENIAISKGLCKNHYYQYKRGTLIFENGKFIKKLQ